MISTAAQLPIEVDSLQAKHPSGYEINRAQQNQ